jgi:hypothetical protein
VKIHALALFVFCLLGVVLLGGFSGAQAALSQTTATPVSTQTTGTPTAAPSSQARPTTTPNASPGTSDLADVVSAALEKNQTLGAYRLEMSIASGVISPTQELSPTATTHIIVERNGDNIHALVTSSAVRCSPEK